MISYGKITEKEVRQEVQRAIKKYTVLSEVYGQVLAHLQLLDGKHITNARFGSILEKALPLYNVSYTHEKSLGFYIITVWGRGGIDYSERIEMNLQHVLGVYNHNKMLERYGSYTELYSDAQKLRKLLKTIPKVVAKYNKAYDTFEKAVESLRSFGVSVRIY